MAAHNFIRGSSLRMREHWSWIIDRCPSQASHRELQLTSIGRNTYSLSLIMPNI